jgi:hypothetical protein
MAARQGDMVLNMRLVGQGGDGRRADHTAMLHARQQEILHVGEVCKHLIRDTHPGRRLAHQLAGAWQLLFLERTSGIFLDLLESVRGHNQVSSGRLTTIGVEVLRTTTQWNGSIVERLDSMCGR